MIYLLYLLEEKPRATRMIGTPISPGSVTRATQTDETSCSVMVIGQGKKPVKQMSLGFSLVLPTLAKMCPLCSSDTVQ